MNTVTVGDKTDALCPRCNGPMLWRKNKTRDEYFMGCKSYPACTGTRNADGVSSRVNVAVQAQHVRIIKALVLNAEDECLTLRDKDFENVDLYDLHIDAIADEGAYVLTVVKR